MAWRETMEVYIVESDNTREIYSRADDRVVDMPRIKHLKGKEFKQYLEMYFEYIEAIDLSDMDVYQIFESILPYYYFLKAHNVPCDIVLYAEEPKNSFAEKELEYLGMDILVDEVESLISHWVYRGFTEYLNENGLCETKEDCQKIIEKNAKMTFPVYSSDRELTWEFYYLYKIVC